MDVAELVLDYVKVLVWPATVAAVLGLYRDALVAALRRGTIEFEFSAAKITTTPEDLDAAPGWG